MGDISSENNLDSFVKKYNNCKKVAFRNTNAVQQSGVFLNKKSHLSIEEGFVGEYNVEQDGGNIMDIKFVKRDMLKEKPDQKNLGFGKYMTDYMFVMDWDKGQGWHDARIEPYGPVSIHPSCVTLHYALPNNCRSDKIARNNAAADTLSRTILKSVIIKSM